MIIEILNKGVGALPLNKKSLTLGPRVCCLVVIKHTDLASALNGLFDLLFSKVLKCIKYSVRGLSVTSRKTNAHV